jgi:hypothetical protein
VAQPKRIEEERRIPRKNLVRRDEKRILLFITDSPENLNRGPKFYGRV